MPERPCLPSYRARRNRRTRSIGIAKPIPSPRLERAVVMPTSSPARLNSGPPELPKLIAASSWITASWRLASTSVRWRAETIPVATVPSNPTGEPIANTCSPRRRSADRPRATVVKRSASRSRTKLRIATSSSGSAAMIRAARSRPSTNRATSGIASMSPPPSCGCARRTGSIT